MIVSQGGISVGRSFDGHDTPFILQPQLRSRSSSSSPVARPQPIASPGHDLDHSKRPGQSTSSAKNGAPDVVPSASTAQSPEPDKAAFQDLMAEVEASRQRVLAAATGAQEDIVEAVLVEENNVKGLLERLQQIGAPSVSGVRLRK